MITYICHERITPSVRSGDEYMPFREYDQSQTKIAWINYRGMLGEDHPAVIINDVVEYLGTEDIEQRYGEIGNPPYHPKLMVKTLIYGYSQGYFGGRPIYNNFMNDLGLRYLTNDDFPDHRTINLFRITFKDEFAEIFAKVVTLCIDLGLIGFENLAIDSQKLKANANLFQNKNMKGIQRELERIKKEILKLLEQDLSSDLQAIEQKRTMELLERRQKKLEEALIVLKAAGGENDPNIRFNLTDPESKVMTDKTGAKHPDYLVQNAVDDKCQVVTAFEVTNIPTDVGQLEPMKEASKKNTGRSHKHTAADAGYSTKEEYPRMASDPDTEYFVPDRTKESSKKDPYSKWKFKYVPEHDVFICPNNKVVYLARVIEEDGREVLVYEAEDCTGCPFGKHCLGKTKQGDENPSHNRTITIYPEDEYIKAMRTKLDSEAGKAIYQRRMATVEPFHGDIQKNRGFRQFNLRGLEKVNIEYCILSIAHNIRKIRLHARSVFYDLFHKKSSCAIAAT